METVGDKLWGRFNAGRNDIEWYYRSIFEKLSDMSGTKMYGEYKSVLESVFGTENVRA